jgi:hypothetical protein
MINALVIIRFPKQGRFPFKQGWSPLGDFTGLIPPWKPDSFRLADDPAVTEGLPTTLAEGTSRIAVQVTQDLAAASQ